MARKELSIVVVGGKGVVEVGEVFTLYCLGWYFLLQGMFFLI